MEKLVDCNSDWVCSVSPAVHEGLSTARDTRLSISSISLGSVVTTPLDSQLCQRVSQCSIDGSNFFG
jgi:hypothetical protein